MNVTRFYDKMVNRFLSHQNLTEILYIFISVLVDVVFHISSVDISSCGPVSMVEIFTKILFK